MHKHLAFFFIVTGIALTSYIQAQTLTPGQTTPATQDKTPLQQTPPNSQPIPPYVQYLRETTTTPYQAPRKAVKQRHKASRKAVRTLKKKNFSEAVSGFRSALKADSSYAKAQYNAAIAHAGLQQNDSALNYYQRVCENSSATKEQRANAHYNAGNIHLRKALAVRDTGGYDGQELRSAILEYRSSLRLDPKNDKAKHNLSLATQLLRPEQGGGGGNNQNQQNQQNQNDNQNQQNQNDNQNQQNQQNQNDNQQQQDKQQGQQGKQDKQQQEQRRREAEQMLNAMKNNEQQTMKAVRMKESEKERRQGHPVRIEKDW